MRNNVKQCGSLTPLLCDVFVFTTSLFIFVAFLLILMCSASCVMPIVASGAIITHRSPPAPFSLSKKDQLPLSVAEVQDSLAHQVGSMSSLLQTVVRTQQDMTRELQRLALMLEHGQQASGAAVARLSQDVAALSASMDRSALTAPALSSRATGINEDRAGALAADGSSAGPVAARASKNALGDSAPLSLVSSTGPPPSSSSSSASLSLSRPAAPLLGTAGTPPAAAAADTTRVAPSTTSLKIAGTPAQGEKLGASPGQREEVATKRRVLVLSTPEVTDSFLAEHATVVRDPHIVRTQATQQSSKVELFAVDDMRALEEECGFAMDFPHEVVEAMYQSDGKMPNTFPKDLLSQTHFWVVPPDGALTKEEWNSFASFVDKNVLIPDNPYNMRGIGIVALAEKKSTLHRFVVAARVDKEIFVVTANFLYHLFGVYTIQQERVEQILRDAQDHKLSRQEVYGRLQLFIKTKTPSGQVFLLPVLPARVLAYMIVSRNNPRVLKFRGGARPRVVVRKRHTVDDDEAKDLDARSDEGLSSGRHKRRPKAGVPAEQAAIVGHSLARAPKKRNGNAVIDDGISSADGDDNSRSTRDGASDKHGKREKRAPSSMPHVHAPPSPDMLVLSVIKLTQEYDEFGMPL